MKQIFVQYDFREVKNLLRVVYLIAALVLFGIVNIQAQTTRIWIGAGVPGANGADSNKLDVGANWNPAGKPGVLDSCVMNFSDTGSYLLTIRNGIGLLSMKALTINLTGLASNTVVTKVDFNINRALDVVSSLTINNSSLSPLFDTVNFNIGTAPAGTVTCGSLTVRSAQNGVINIENNTTFTVNDFTTLTNTGNTSLRFITANGDTTTLNGKTVIGTRFPGQWSSNLKNKILIGSTTNAANGTFVINGDSLILGFNMGTEKFSKGTILFNGIAKQVVSSYAKDDAPDRVTGTIQIGGGVLSKVYFEKGGGTDNDALVVKNAVIVNNDCLLSVRTVAIPSDGSLLNPDGLIQLNAGATFVIGTKAGTSSSLPDSYKTYSFHPTSTVIYDGINRQIIYAGANYGNVEINGADTAIKTSGGSINILGYLLIQAGKTFVASDSANKTITVKGNWTNNGTFIPKTSTVSFDSSTNVSIGGSTPTDFYKLRINKNSGGTVTMGKDVTVSDTATLAEGEFKLNGNRLTLNGKIAGTGTGTLTGSAASSLYIGGTDTLGTLNFTGGAQTLGELTMNRSGSGLATMGTDLTVAATANFTNGAFAINANTLSLNGITTGNINGTISGSQTSGLIIGGTANSLYFTAGGFNNYLKSFTINSGGGAALGNALNIAAGTYASSGVLTTTGTLITNGFLTLKSDASGDARVGFSTGTITGETTVERYIPATRAWRFLSVPFSATSQTINQAWQESETNTSVSCSYVDPTPPGFGTQLTGIGSIAGSGYDFNNTGNPSLRYWDNLAWKSPSSTLGGNKLTDHPAWYVFIRGDRHICLNGVYPPNVTTLRAKGTLIQQGGVNATAYNFSGSANQWFMAGNPYASPINLQNVINGGRVNGFQADKIWVMDPKQTGDYGVGGYATYSSGVWTPSASYPGSYGNQPIIQSGQGFMVYTSSTSASVQLQEGDKTPTERNVFGLMASPAKKPRQFPVVYASLMSADTAVIIDGVASGFDRSFSAAVDEKDAQKLWNVGENLALMRHDTALAIEFRPIPKTNDTLFYRLYLKQQPYVFKIFTANVNAEVPAEAWLVDKYLNTQTPVKLGDTTLYAFAPNPDTNSYRNRFMIVWNRADDKIATVVKPENSINSTAVTASLYPNPVDGKEFNLVLNNLEQGSYTVNIYTNAGKLAATRHLNFEKGKQTYTVDLPLSITSGSYRAVVVRRNGTILTSVHFIKR